MKKRLALTLALLLAPTAFGQSVGGSQIRKKTGGGLVADTGNALAIGIYRGTSAPASPVTGQLWQDTTTTPAIWKAWTGAAWEAAPSTAAVTQADLASFPSAPTDGQLLWVRSLKRLLVYDSDASAWYYMNDPGRMASAHYSLETAGYSSAFLTAPSVAPTLAVGTGTSTAGTHKCAVTFFNSSGGETMPGPSSAALTTTAVQGIGVSGIETGGAGTVGRRLWCSKVNTSAPLFRVATIEDNTTTTVTVTGADSTFSPHAAPDVDFSAPIPSGWTLTRPGSGAPYGGCGSTGTSLLCVTYAFSNAGTAANAGVRLAYYVTDESGYWFARFKIKRANASFTGHASTMNNGIVFPFVASAMNVDAPVMRGYGPMQAADVERTSWAAYPGTKIGRHTRATGAAWSYNFGNGATFYRVPFTDPAVPVWFGWASEGGTPSGRMMLSGNGKDWNNFVIETPGQVLRWVGVTTEIDNASSTMLGAVIEISDFSVEAWP